MRPVLCSQTDVPVPRVQMLPRRADHREHRGTIVETLQTMATSMASDSDLPRDVQLQRNGALLHLARLLRKAAHEFEFMCEFDFG